MTLTAAQEAELVRANAYFQGLEAGRKQLIDQLWATIPEYVREQNYNPDLAAGVPMEVHPAFTDLVLITSIVYNIPQGATGIIQLGELAIPVSPGTGIFAPVEVMLQQTDTRAITIATASGPVTLILLGRRLPTTGVMQG